MQFKYNPFFSEFAFNFIFGLEESDSQMIMLEIRLLGNNPHRESHFTELDDTGREIQGIISGSYCILYWVDHAVKEIKVTQIRYADR
jgi:hypothetical protein|tara:strand:- start:124 stop:384 length:261 start_codon:yes stop_codon:yes gene_type:complete